MADLAWLVWAFGWSEFWLVWASCSIVQQFSSLAFPNPLIAIATMDAGPGEGLYADQEAAD